MQQLIAATTHELFKPLIAPSLVMTCSRCEISDCTISCSRCEISDDVVVLVGMYTDMNDMNDVIITILTTAFFLKSHH